MRVNREETARYLGMAGHSPDARAAALIEDCARELEACASPRQVSRLVAAEAAGGRASLAGIAVESRELASRLTGCREAFLLAVTLGAETDRLLHKYGRLDVGRAAVLDAAAWALLEDWFGECRGALEREAGARGLYLLPRFGPGYGDFPLEFQAELLTLLNAGRRIGLTLTDSRMLLPAKSLTAVLGLTETPQSCAAHNCESCGALSCPYRKGTNT